MEKANQKLKKVYDETASAILKLRFQNKVSEAEMTFLLSFLDLVVKGKNRELIGLVRKWMNLNSNSETDEFIKTTLLNINFSDSSSLDRSKELIEEILLSYPDNPQ
ncbi:MAG: hypothetical protein ACOX6I_06605 [Syntrophomonadaceae bacterium]|jgi:hypothetical protein